MSSVDWPTVLTSAFMGALSGGLISWVAAPHLKTRESRGAARANAREAIRDAINPEMTKIRQYQALARSSLGRDADREDIHSDDLVLCAKVLNAADNLPWWRRKLVKRRVIGLFGPTTVELCDVHGDYVTNPEAVIGIMLNRQLNARRHPERFTQPDRGQFDRALRHPPESKEIAQLLKSLKRLKSGR